MPAKSRVLGVTSVDLARNAVAAIYPSITGDPRPALFASAISCPRTRAVSRLTGSSRPSKRPEGRYRPALRRRLAPDVLELRDAARSPQCSRRAPISPILDLVEPCEDARIGLQPLHLGQRVGQIVHRPNSRPGSGSRSRSRAAPPRGDCMRKLAKLPCHELSFSHSATDTITTLALPFWVMVCGESWAREITATVHSSAESNLFTASASGNDHDDYISHPLPGDAPRIRCIMECCSDSRRTAAIGPRKARAPRMRRVAMPCHPGADRVART